MMRFGLLAVTIAAALLAGTPARAGSVPGSGGLPAPRPMALPLALLPPPKPLVGRYPMTYSENVARSLGLEGGDLNLVPQSKNPYVPRVSLNGNMLRLQWRP